MSILHTKLLGQALADVSELARSHGPDVQKKYRSMVLSFPNLIQTSGLAQAVTFLKQKGGRADRDRKPENVAARLLLTHLGSTEGLPQNEDIVALVADAELDMYVFYTQRTMESLVFYKRFSESLLEKDDR